MSEMWNSLAEAWERNADFVDDHMAAATEAMLDAAQLKAGDAVLDLASGPGGAGLAAAARVGGEAPDESFNAVICRHGLMFAEPPVAAVAEARGVLRKGGRYGRSPGTSEPQIHGSG